MGLPDHLFVCTSNNRDLVNIELFCMDGTKIDIVGVWEFESNHTYSCTNNNTATSPEERKYDMLNPRLWHKILTNCAGERHCNFVIRHNSYAFYTTDTSLELLHAGIEIGYNCLPENKFAQFCHQSTTIMRHKSNVILIFKNASSTGKNICSCLASPFPRFGLFNVTLTVFPTNSGYVKEKSYEVIKYYRRSVFNKTSVFLFGQRVWSVGYDLKNLSEDVPFVLVKLSGNWKYIVNCSDRKTIESLEQTTETESSEKTELLTTTLKFLDPEQPVQETNPVVGYAVTVTVTAITILGIGACTIIVYYRHEKKKKEITPNKKGNVKASSKRLSGKSKSLVSFDCADSLSHSYAEVGSISDYRHYVMPDDTSVQSFRMKILFEEFEEASHYVSSANLDSKPPEHTATEQTQHDMNNADKTDTENSATAKEEACKSKSKMPENIESVHLQNEKTENEMPLVLAETTDKCKLDKNTDLPKNSGAEHKFDRENKTISREHYDTFGYLDLNITEKTSHQYLQKWIKEIYSVEESARKEGENEEIQQVGQRRVLIAENDIADKEPDTFYSYANFHTIEFSDEETPLN